ncbi:MAG: hypothetical protein QOG38_2095 [Hyphomicrobiales bacterium]|nr:hypothetical protein [Hyphomicrobiales bacterium]
MNQNKELRAFHKERLRKQIQKASGAFEHALALHRRGLIADAQAAYRQILQKVPAHFEALHHLGIAECQAGRFEEADRILQQAVNLEPRSAAAQSNRGVVLLELGRFEDALASFDTALAIDSTLADAWSNRGNALTKLGRCEDAVASYDKAIALKPDHADALGNRGNALTELRRFGEALASCEKAIAIKPNFADAHSNAGFALHELKRSDEALANFDKALAINPRLAAAWLGRGNVLLDTNHLADAMAAYHKALAARPDYLKAMVQLAGCLLKQGNAEEAISFYDKALAIKPDFADAISNRIFSLDFIASAGFPEHQEARRQWWNEVGVKIAAASRVSHDNDRDPARRLVIGYVSSDFNRHSAATAFRPVLRHHDKAEFKIICYSCSLTNDDATQEFRGLADVWRDAAQLSDEQLAAQILADRVDILVDLSGHTSGNRLAVFARKPAPVQVTAWGHATGTGLETIDYLFADPVSIPAEARHLFAEKVYDLPCLITMEPLPYAIAASDPPALSRGYVTFGSFNRIGKISDDAVAVWAQILAGAATARLLVKDVTLDDERLCATLRDRFARHGIAAERIDVMGASTREQHLTAITGVDICLDPFPHNGGISTWEPLRLGVPVVSLLGNSVPSRASGAILSSIGMRDWVASDRDAYRTTALNHAAQPDRLAALRREMPARIAASAAGDSAAYTRAVEGAYRAMWRTFVGVDRPAAVA